jgi:hypothetical protein
VNFRHVFYTFSFPRHLIQNRFARLHASTPRCPSPISQRPGLSRCRWHARFTGSGAASSAS